ncbi:hypothetical protein CC78DRAFT_573844 [Lojkania enalia]|uniref:Uncharacterized protein n=1 Tax=Lojkania enalia TaxID=147567 RepID=A0A9P4TRP4_9PLEO|nr:hypothetical protein CC78DRAFT_573844 [Didymosphaeria enalia]
MSSPLPRRFKVEPIETTSKSSKAQTNEQSDGYKPRRRFVPEPIETTTMSHRKDDSANVQTSHKPVRRFAPEPVETVARSSRVKNQPEPADNVARRFKPELVETTGNSSRKVVGDKSSQEKRPPRRFPPQLIETAKRSRRVGDARPALLPSDKTEATPGSETYRSPKKCAMKESPAVPNSTPTSGPSQNAFFLEIKRQASPFSMRCPRSRASTRSHHSFRIPELDPIESSESDGSPPASPSTSPSAASDHSFMYKEATRMRESVDERSSGYLLELAARAAEKQLREQAMAAFPNDDYHEPVDHFIDRDSDESDISAEDPKRSREISFTEVNWELLAMRRHHEETEKQRQKEDELKKRREAEMNRPVYNPWGNAATLINPSRGNNAIMEWQKDKELDRMRKEARPPMLGGDIKFPRCRSPEPARFDPTQGSHIIKRAMCYPTEPSHENEKGEGLWCGKKTSNSRHSLWSNASSRRPSHGLWGGCCVNTGLTPPSGPTGLLTPKIEIENPLETPCPTPTHELPPTPPASNADFAGIDEKLETERAIEEEFGDNFVTQVYNYLSLGYPSVARMFDQELARISQIALEDLRVDDHLATSRGYIRLGSDGNLKNSDITEESCMRWRALRIYIHEWARQQPGMVAGDNNMGGIGTAVRRGSWAI